MKVQTVISIEAGDFARKEAMEDVFAWIGGYCLGEADAKPFGRVRGNAFTLEDVDRIGEIVRREAARPIRVSFGNPAVQRGHEEGMRAARESARARLEQFRSDLRDDLAAAGFPRPESA